MPVQRKVFRIEERARSGPPHPAGVEGGEWREGFTAELESLRALLGPAAPVDRPAMERARAQIAEAQAYKSELDLIHAAVKRARDDAGTPGAIDGDRTARVGRELGAIVSGTERATQAILQAAEEIDRIAGILAAAVKTEHDRGLARDIQDRVVSIFEACNFQDLTGQRVANVIEALKFIEEHVVRLKTIWQDLEALKPIAGDVTSRHERRYLNGPKLPGDGGHATQDDIDGMFGCA